MCYKTVVQGGLYHGSRAEKLTNHESRTASYPGAFFIKKMLSLNLNQCFSTTDLYIKYWIKIISLLKKRLGTRLNHGYLNFALKLFTCHAKHVRHGSRRIFF